MIARTFEIPDRPERSTPRVKSRSIWLLTLLAVVVIALLVVTLSCGNGCLDPADMICLLYTSDAADE